MVQEADAVFALLDEPATGRASSFNLAGANNRSWVKPKLGLSFRLMVDSVHTARYRLLCELLIEARAKCGLSQAVIADKLGEHQTFVSKYEHGERRLDVVEFLDVAEILGLDPLKVLRKLREH